VARGVSNAACLACERERQTAPQYRAAVRRYRATPEGRAANREAQRRWRQESPDKHNATQARRRSRKLQATPPWEVHEREQITALYAYAKQHGLAVDHIIPLRGQKYGVCGLHCLSNLAMLEPSANSAKSCTFDPSRFEEQGAVDFGRGDAVRANPELFYTP